MTLHVLYTFVLKNQKTKKPKNQKKNPNKQNKKTNPKPKPNPPTPQQKKKPIFNLTRRNILVISKLKTHN